MKTDEDYEFERIERENRIRSSGMECCTYDCIQGRDCPIRKQKYNMAISAVPKPEGQGQPSSEVQPRKL